MTSKEREAQRKPRPSEVIELLDTGVYSLVELPDGSLLSNNARRSTDGGTTWSEPRFCLQTFCKPTACQRTVSPDTRRH